MDGFLLIDKKKGETSFEVVKRVRKETSEKKVGHAGTLDKLANGLMLVALGRGTKLLEYLISCDKEYEVKAKFGYESETYDSEGPVKEVNKEAFFSEDALKQAIEENFLGKIEQLPPKYSALKVKGKRASDRVRAGEEVMLEPREIEIYEFEILDFDWPEVDFRVECSAGTYMRSLIHDLGKELGCGGYVMDLKRTRIRGFSRASEDLISLEEMAGEFLQFELDDEEFESLKDGKILSNKKIEHEEPVMAMYKGKLIGVLENSKDGHGIKYRKVI